MNKQSVRLIDVFAIGPFLIYAGAKHTPNKTIGIVLIGLGIATIVYNGVNYLKNDK